jgi:hypothetical protein
MLIFGGISYIGARKIALKLGEDRLKTLSGQLSTMIAGNVHNHLSAAYSVANKPAVKKYLLSNAKDLCRGNSEIAGVTPGRHLICPGRIKNSKGVTLISSAGIHPHLNINIDSLVTSSAEKNDTGRVEKLFASGNSIYYPIIVNITENKQLIGYIVRWRRVVSTPKALDQLSRLMGTDACIFVGNMDGSLWTDLLKPCFLTTCKGPRRK